MMTIITILVSLWLYNNGVNAYVFLPDGENNESPFY